MTSLEASSTQHPRRWRLLPLKFALSLGAKQEIQAVEKDLLDNASSINLKGEVATVMMVQTTSPEEQIASLTCVLNEFKKQDLSVECNTSKGIHVTDGFFCEHVKNIVNEAIAKTYETQVQAFKSYVKPYTRRIEQLRMPVNYDLQSFNNSMVSWHPRNIAHFVETCNNVGIDEDLLVEQFLLSLKDAAFDWYIDLEANSINSWDDLQNKFFNRFYSARRTFIMIELANQHQEKDEPVLDCINTWTNLSLNCKDTLSEISAIELCIQVMHWELCYILQAIKSKTFGELATRAHGIEMSFNCKEDEYLVDASDDDGDGDDATP
ncbi:UNVERIFIED_CONTAM: hypothetical protein Slati_2504600 [Sesamum latifolium]|uniref:Retrotransposon gag domain-containing protein n=1 Tax=Sesamum latifolium TaxID=2727402 RepID=A0AAW2WK70_9LAMI